MAATPDLLLPVDQGVGRLGSLEFSWEPVDGGVDYYVLQLAEDAAFTTLVSQLETTFTRVQQEFPLGRDYYWRVHAHDGVDVLTSSTFRLLSAPAFAPASLPSHVEDGKGLMLQQFKESE